MSEGEISYFPEGDPAISSARDQVQAEALDLVRKAHSIFIVAVYEKDGQVAASSLAYGDPVALPIAVQNEAPRYLLEAAALLEDEGIGQ